MSKRALYVGGLSDTTPVISSANYWEPMAPYLAPMSSKTNIVENRPGYGFVEMGSSDRGHCPPPLPKRGRDLNHTLFLFTANLYYCFNFTIFWTDHQQHPLVLGGSLKQRGIIIVLAFLDRGLAAFAII